MRANICSEAGGGRQTKGTNRIRKFFQAIEKVSRAERGTYNQNKENALELEPNFVGKPFRKKKKLQRPREPARINPSKLRIKKRPEIAGGAAPSHLSQGRNRRLETRSAPPVCTRDGAAPHQGSPPSSSERGSLSLRRACRIVRRLAYPMIGQFGGNIFPEMAGVVQVTYKSVRGGEKAFYDLKGFETLTSRPQRKKGEKPAPC